MKLRVVLPEFPWWQCLEDLAFCLYEALVGIGKAECARACYGSDAVHVILGAHHPAVDVPDGPFVIYQTEPPGTGSWWDESTDAGRKFRDKLNRATAVWDCSPNYKTPVDEAKRAVVLPGFYKSASESANKNAAKDIDILFYGSLSERRQQILERLQDAGLKPSVHFGVFGADRNRLIDRSKLVLDIKQRETDPSDESRNFFLDSRGACVLSENDPDKRRVLIPDRIVQQCRGLLASDGMRDYHAKSRRADLKPTDVSDGLRVLERQLAKSTPERWDGPITEHGFYEGAGW